MKVGFIGIGHMGEPMASNLLRAGIPLVVWNRSTEKCARLGELGAERAVSVRVLLDRCTTVMLMLLDRDAIDSVLGHGTQAFATNVRGKTIVHLGTTSPAYSLELQRDILAAGGDYVEAPVSGSRLPAERGELIGMVAGDDNAVAACSGHPPSGIPVQDTHRLGHRAAVCCLFRTPIVWGVAPLSAVGGIVLFLDLPPAAQLVFPVWGVPGLTVYYAYERRPQPSGCRAGPERGITLNRIDESERSSQ